MSGGLRLRSGIAGAAGTVGHELVELSLVLCLAQPVEKRLELALLFFQAAQGLGAVFIKCSIAARRPIAASAPTLGSRLHPLEAPLHPLDPPLPTIRTGMCPARHSSTPYQESKKQKAERPKQSMMMHGWRPSM